MNTLLKGWNLNKDGKRFCIRCDREFDAREEGNWPETLCQECDEEIEEEIKND